MMKKNKFNRLIRRDIISANELERFIGETKGTNSGIEDLLLARGVPKHEILFCLSEHYGLPFVEFDESVIVSQQIIRRMDMERLKHALWLPLSIRETEADVIACYPDDPAVVDDIRKTLNVDRVELRVALPSDMVRIIEHNQDLNHAFPPSAGRTPLAKVRTFLAERRSMLACYRTSLAKGRTGLAFFRTGVSFITFAVVLSRIFGPGYLTILDVLLGGVGVLMVLDGFRWYIPARRVGRKPIDSGSTEATGGTTVLEVSNPGDSPVFTRSDEVQGAAEVRQNWSNLSPVMRRRFLASDRTDLAEERTVLAGYRTVMARARTGLSFTRTGVALIGLGIGLLRQFQAGPWTAVDAVLILGGSIMVAEGFYWYMPGRHAGAASAHAVNSSANKSSIWDMAFPPLFRSNGVRTGRAPSPPVKGFASPGIWATTGLALERTLLAERRNVMARLRTVMARSRTGMAFIRTGMSISAVGSGLLVYFGSANAAWTVFNGLLIGLGLLFIADGLYWHLPAEKTRKQFPYCYGEMEITIPDYGMPARSWRKAVFSHDDV